MSRMVKCKICGKQIPQAEAYKVTTTKDDGKKINKYYCDSIELESYEQDILKNKQDKENVFNIINEILGYECVNFNIITKELTPILKVYTYEEIYNCFSIQKDKIKELLNFNNIDKEYNRIRYIFTVITGNIADNTYELKQNNKVKNQEIVEKITSEDIDLEDLPFSDYTYTETKGIDFSDLF